MVDDDGSLTGTLALHRLPLAEDYREYLFSRLLSGSQLSAHQRIAISAFVDSITVKTSVKREVTVNAGGSSSSSSSFSEDFEPTTILTPFPALQKIHYERQNRALEIPESQRIHLVNPFKSLADDPTNPSAQRALQSVKEAFPLQAAAAAKDRKRKFWSDIEVEVEGALSGAAESKEVS